MTTSTEIRLDYGAWSGDDGESTDRSSSPEDTLVFHHQNQIDHIWQTTGSRRQLSEISASDLFSDSNDSICAQDFLAAEMNTRSSANNPQITSRPWQRSRAGGDGGRLDSTGTSTFGSPVIDLSDSPPQPSHRPATAPQPIFPSPDRQPRTSMAPALRSSRQSRRGHIDTPSSQHAEDRPHKRRRLSQRSGDAQRPALVPLEEEVEAVDLTGTNEESDLSRALSKQQQDAVQAQMKDSQGDHQSGRTALSSYKCPICMDTPEDATSTVCGHLFCHKCIIDTLRFSEQQRRDDTGTNKAKGTCPVCRKPLARKDEPGIGRTLVPLEIRLTTRRGLKGKAVVGRNGQGTFGAGRMVAKTERESSADMWRDLTTLDHI